MPRVLKLRFSRSSRTVYSYQLATQLAHFINGLVYPPGLSNTIWTFCTYDDTRVIRIFALQYDLTPKTKETESEFDPASSLFNLKKT